MIEIEAFIAIAQTGSFTAAAAQVFITQPAISRRIELLERELGAPLFERGRGGATLTDAGEVFHAYAQQALASLRDGSQAIDDLRDGKRGRVSLALVGTLTSTRLTARIRAFREANPNIRLALRTARSDEVSLLVQTGEAAIGLRYFPDPSPVIESQWVEDEELCIVCASDSRIVPAGDLTAASLQGIPWVSFPIGAGSSGEAFTNLVRRQLAAHQLDGAEIVAIDSLTAQKRLIEADFGLGMLPKSSIEEELRLDTLRVLSLPEMATMAPVYAIRRKGGYLSAAALGMLAMLLTPSNT
ncbi:MAG: LysR family transcriptional regulator [Thermomicrobiales bacterium]